MRRAKRRASHGGMHPEPRTAIPLDPPSCGRGKVKRASFDVTGCVLGFDYGSRRIGVASGNRISGTAHPLAALTARTGEPDWARVDALLVEWQPEALIVGLPLALDGGEQAITRAARAFADTLARRGNLPVHLVDERHTSQEAARRFATRRQAGSARRGNAADIDSLAAVVILESWLTDAQARPEDANG